MMFDGPGGGAGCGRGLADWGGGVALIVVVLVSFHKSGSVTAIVT